MGLWRKTSLRRPVVSGVLGMVAAVVTLRLDAAMPAGWLGWSPPTTGTSVMLGAVLGSIITVSALVFWVRGMFVQLSAGQLSSRVVRWYLADHYQQRMLDFLVGVFGYLTVVTLALDDASTAPTLSTLVSVALSVAALIIVIVTITDSARTTQLNEVMAHLTRETIRAVDETHPPHGHGVTRRTTDDTDLDGSARLPVRAQAAGWVGHIHDDRLAAALPPGTTLRLWTRAGTFVLRDSIIGDVVCAADYDPSEVIRAIQIGRTRQVANDVELGLRNLVDIALQALATGTRDATSAYEAINHLSSVVHEVLVRDLPRDRYEGPDGRCIVRMAELTYADYIDLAFDQIRQSGAMYPAIASVLLTSLHMLIDAVVQAGLPERVPPLQQQIDLVRDRIERTDLAAPDRERVLRQITAHPNRPHTGEGSAHSPDAAGR